ncbi:glutathione-S-transferase [Mycena sanguinolenta]|nr:glutathione-S-transferase [Mycena sanguinolenta]
MPIPDEQIFPHATGNAKLTVDAHQEPQELIFYSGWFCPYVQRSWICLEEKGIPYQYKEVNPYKKEKDFLDLNPKGLVPTVQYQGKALYESLVLCEFFDEAYPSHKPDILPGDAYTKAYARIWVDFVGKSCVPAFMRLIQAQEEEKRDLARTELYDALRKFAAQIKGPYFLGDRFSLVDVAIVPWITRDYIVAENRKYSREEVSAEWKRYADHVEQRESVLKTKSERDKYAEIYGRYLRDEAQSEAAKAIRSGRVIP